MRTWRDPGSLALLVAPLLFHLISCQITAGERFRYYSPPQVRLRFRYYPPPGLGHRPAAAAPTRRLRACLPSPSAFALTPPHANILSCLYHADPSVWSTYTRMAGSFVLAGDLLGTANVTTDEECAALCLQQGLGPTGQQACQAWALCGAFFLAGLVGADGWARVA